MHASITRNGTKIILPEIILPSILDKNVWVFEENVEENVCVVYVSV